MHTIITAIIISILSLLLMQWLPLPWYTALIITFIVAIVARNLKVKPFLCGGLSIGFFWLIKILFVYGKNDGILVGKMAGVFSEQIGITVAPFILLLVTILIGFLLGGLSFLSGYLISQPSSQSIGYRAKSSSAKSYKLKLN